MDTETKKTNCEKYTHQTDSKQANATGVKRIRHTQPIDGGTNDERWCRGEENERDN